MRGNSFGNIITPRRFLFAMPALFLIVCSPPDFLGKSMPGLIMENASMLPVSSNSATQSSTDPRYRIGSGDVVEILFRIDENDTLNEYALNIGDRILVEFHGHPEYSKQVTIIPPGMITLFPIGEIKIKGLSSRIASRVIEKKFSEIINDPLVIVTAVECNQQIKEFIRAIATSTNAQSKSIKIAPDGSVSFPFLPQINVLGFTVHQLQDSLQVLYKGLFQTLSISISLMEAYNNVVYVCGEVSQPSVYPLIIPTTVSQMVIRAGVTLKTANLAAITVISHNSQYQQERCTIDMESFLSSGNYGVDKLLKQYDVIFIPSKKIVDVNRWIDLYINQLIPRFFGVSAGYSLK
ncbi:polysaccharide biosynthesis/export family protein [bacterium]|nr:polysaccharide biosynthesis/export family protein [candidate division CSSED10-310 bacterium]